MPRAAHRRVLAYARVSSAEQALGTSLQDQQDAIRRYVSTLGLEVARMYVEAVSAVREKIESRAQMRALLADVRSGDLVVCYALDRWSRDPEFTYRSLRELTERGASFFAVADNCDPSTPDGDTMLNVRVLVAKEEHKRIKLRLVGTRRILRDAGYWVEGAVPWGYRRPNVARGIERHVLITDEPEADRVRESFALCERGTPIRSLAPIVGVTIPKLWRTLRSRVSLGEILNTHGDWVPGRHPAIVDPRLWLAANAGLVERRSARWSAAYPDADTASWWLRDVARCARCGARMSSVYADRHAPNPRGYFKCAQRCTVTYVRVSRAEAACEPLVLARLTELREQLASPARSRAVAADADVTVRRSRIDARRSRALTMFEDGHIDRGELRARIAKLDLERIAVDAESVIIPAPSIAQLAATLRNVRELARRWLHLDGVARRAIVRTIAKVVRLAGDEPPIIDWVAAAELAAERAT